MIRTVLALAAVFAPFFVPWPYAVMLAIAASALVPPIALIVGLIFEVMYGTGAVPYAFMLGALGMALMYGVRSFMKARIMGA